MHIHIPATSILGPFSVQFWTGYRADAMMPMLLNDILFISKGQATTVILLDLSCTSITGSHEMLLFNTEVTGISFQTEFHQFTPHTSLLVTRTGHYLH